MTSPDSMQRLIDQGMASRTVGSTAMNDTSSRSHSVFTVKVSGGNVSRLTRGIYSRTNNHEDNNPNSNWHNVAVLLGSVSWWGRCGCPFENFPLASSLEHPPELSRGCKHGKGMRNQTVANPRLTYTSPKLSYRPS